MNIALDMMGGDFAPLEAVKGIKLFLAEGSENISLTLIGDENMVKELLISHAVSSTNIAVVHASQVIEMQDI